MGQVETLYKAKGVTHIETVSMFSSKTECGMSVEGMERVVKQGPVFYPYDFDCERCLVAYNQFFRKVHHFVEA